jgi:hypothetical protein
LTISGSGKVTGCVEPLESFVFLQLLDLMTTLIGFKLGASEASPFVRLLTTLGPTTGVLLSKGVAICLGAACIQIKRMNVISWINYWYASLIVWNLLMIFRALSAQ